VQIVDTARILQVEVVGEKRLELGEANGRESAWKEGGREGGKKGGREGG